MRNYVARQNAHAKVNAVIKRHLEAMSLELAAELANSIDPESEFGKTMERFINFDDPNGEKKTKITISNHIVSVSKPTLPETYKGYGYSWVHLEDRMIGCFPFDIYFELKPFDHRDRTINDIRTWYNTLDLNHERHPDDTDMPEDKVYELSDMLDEIKMDFDELQKEQDEDRFWHLVGNLGFRLQDAHDLLSEYDEGWA